MANQYFGTDGIRGRANTAAMSAELALKVGQAAGALIHEAGEGARVVIGKDTRLSGYMIENALTSGFISSGVDVLLLGPMPTPAVAMLTKSMRANLGVMITASHNPHHDNGIKLFNQNGSKISEDTQDHIAERINGFTPISATEPEDLGRATRLEGAHARYAEFVKRSLFEPLDLSGYRVVIDTANGAGYKVAPEVLWELGAEVIKLGDQPNGTNINEDCGSTKPQSLMSKVKQTRADIGIALDGDGDRVLIVDEQGAVIDGNHLLGFMAAEWSAEGALRGDCLVTTDMSNLGVEVYLNDLGIQMKRTQVGDRYVAETMRTDGHNLGGETSGHIILGDHSLTGDGLIAALHVIALLKKRNMKASQLNGLFQLFPELQMNIKVNNKSMVNEAKFQAMVKDKALGLQGRGRILVRPSGTEQLVRILVESDLEADLGVINDLARDIERLAC